MSSACHAFSVAIYLTLTCKMSWGILKSRFYFFYSHVSDTANSGKVRNIAKYPIRRWTWRDPLIMDKLRGRESGGQKILPCIEFRGLEKYFVEEEKKFLSAKKVSEPPERNLKTQEKIYQIRGNLPRAGKIFWIKLMAKIVGDLRRFLKIVFFPNNENRPVLHFVHRISVGRALSRGYMLDGRMAVLSLEVLRSSLNIHWGLNSMEILVEGSARNIWQSGQIWKN